MSGITITVATSQVTVADGHGTVAVSVTNTEATPQRLVLGAYPPAGPSAGGASPSAHAWTSIERPQRTVAAGATDQYVASFDPQSVPPGSYPVKFIAYSADEAPEDYSEQGQTVTVSVPGAAAPVAAGRKTPWWIFVAAAVVVILIAGVIWFLTRTTTAATVAVPNLVGTAQADAQNQLAAANLGASVTNSQTTTGIGTVLGQNPQAGTQSPAGSTVTLTVGVQAQATVPALVGLSQADATTKLTALGLQVQTIEQQSPTGVGTVLAQDQPAGSNVAVGSAVTITVGVPVQVVVPAVVGLTQADATARLATSGLQTATVGKQTNLPVNSVLAQDQAPGSSVPVGSTVTVTVAIPIVPLHF